MALTELQRLTEAHRLAQARLGAQTVRATLDVWSLLDPADLAGSFPTWLRALHPVVDVHRGLSARLAGNYMTLSRSMALGDTSMPALVLAEQVPLEQLTSSMLVTGPGSIRRSMSKGVMLQRAIETARARTAASAMRLALNGGRETITESVKRDRRALGWSRATSGAACAFCRMLASRGPVYKSRESATFPAHDGCSCSSAPVYRRSDPWPAGARQNKATWDETTKGLHGSDALNAFRRAVEGR